MLPAFSLENSSCSQTWERGSRRTCPFLELKKQCLIPLQLRSSFTASLSFFFDCHPGSKEQSFQRHNSSHSYKQVHLVKDTQRTKAFLQKRNESYSPNSADVTSAALLTRKLPGRAREKSGLRVRAIYHKTVESQAQVKFKQERFPKRQ